MRKRFFIMMSVICLGILSGCGNKTSDEQLKENDISAEDTVEEETADRIGFIAGDSQSDAALIPLDERINGTIDDNEEDWYAFTTGDDPNTVYNVTVTNTTVDSPILYVSLYTDVERYSGTILVDYKGQSGTISMNGNQHPLLDSNTVYYVCITTNGAGGTDYSLVVKDPDSEATSYQTAGNIIEALGASHNEEVYVGTNQVEAALLPFGVKVSGKVIDERTAWFAFKTEKESGISYNITFENLTEDTYPLHVNVYDEYGDRQAPGANAQNEDGQVTLVKDDLYADTLYYVCLEGDTLEYSLMIDAPEKETPLKVEEPLVFEVPFEINETQIPFVKNSAEFIDIEQAKEKLQPVAEAILEHPDNSVLIAGTTATDGTQEYCVDLSNRRAQAVKDLLVSTFAVPESQLQIIGLGYEKDPFERGSDRDSNGNFVESEGRKNRRVVIMDLNDSIAQEILTNNQ